MDGRKLTLWLILGAALVVLALAAWTRSPALFVLAGVGAAAGLTAWRRSGPR